MDLKIARSNFSQFADYVTIIAEESGTKMVFDVDDCEFFSFAENLIDVAYDVLNKSKKDTDDMMEKLRDVLEELAE